MHLNDWLCSLLAAYAAGARTPIREEGRAYCTARLQASTLS